MGSLLATLTPVATTVSTNVGLAAVAGVTVGIAVYGIRKVWHAFRSM